MRTRLFPALGRQVSEIGLGTWQLGGNEWGDLPEKQALNTLAAAADAGVRFIDTADIYGLGRSESLIGRFLKGRPDRDEFTVATKLGQHPEPGWPENFTRQAIRKHTENSLQRLGLDVIDLMQTHSLPLTVMRDTFIFGYLRELRDEGKIRAFGASVESVEEALFCLTVEGMASLQIIFNIFRQKPIDALFEQAQEKGVALIIRLPLASGLLAGKFTRNTTFPPNDHRSFNRDGQQFNVGETFAGLPFETGLELVERIRPWVPKDMTMAQMALRWCLDFDAVTTVIPGAKRPDQAQANASASDLPSLSPLLHNRLGRFYEAEVAPHIRGKY